jgi:hypothetical protein
MSDSIDLLEAVGRDASLRRLPPDELAARLLAAGGSDALAEAAATRDAHPLADEFGTRMMQTVHAGQGPYRENEEQDEDEDKDDDADESSPPGKPKTH